MTDRPPPGETVLDAFGATSPPVLLPGGERRTYHCGKIVLRCENEPEVEDALFVANLFANIVETDEFRVPRPVRAANGTWLADGQWTAWTYLEGRQATRDDAPELVRALEAFHRALADAPYPSHIERRTSPYGRADRGAFGARPSVNDGHLAEVLDGLYALRRPVEGLHDQVIHGDAGDHNMLIEPGLPPAVIDMALYWRPPEFALAVAAFWMGPYLGDREVLRHFEHVREFDQLLLRACIRSLLVMDGFGYQQELSAYAPAIAIVRERAGA